MYHRGVSSYGGVLLFTDRVEVFDFMMRPKYLAYNLFFRFGEEDFD